MTDADDWPRVTTILRDLGVSRMGPYMEPRYLRRGRLVDWAVGRIAFGKPIPESWWSQHSGEADDDRVEHEECREYVDAARIWIASSGMRFLSAQVEVHHRYAGYVGHLDLLADWLSALWVIDVKCGDPAAWHGWQLALYADAWASEHGGPVPKRANLYLPVGKLVERNDVVHLVEARTLANAHRIIREAA